MEGKREEEGGKERRKGGRREGEVKVDGKKAGRVNEWEEG